jgi:tetratricopeptide (TPR) repeat protein
VTPVFFNVYSSRIFEPDKVALLRSLALIVIAAGLIRLSSQGISGFQRYAEILRNFKSWLPTPLLIPVLSWVVVNIISTVFSVVPSISFWGSYQRQQGLYTTLAYIVFFLVGVWQICHKDQIERLVSTMILASLPVAFYGFLQRLELDPIQWGANTSIRVTANLGNSIFIAAYLVMVFPLTLSRIVLALNEYKRNAQFTRRSHLLKACIYGLILFTQLGAIYFSGSRGPVLGWLAGLYFLVLLLALWWRNRWVILSILAVSLIGAVFLILFNIAEGPFESLRNTPAVGRFGRLLDTESNTAKVRLYIWEGVVKLVSIHEPLKFPDGREDVLNILRPFVGYGPESMFVAYNPFYSTKLAQVERRNASPDRSHNETWDTMVFTGLFGFISYLGLFLSVFYYGLRWLGWIISRTEVILFWSLAFLGGTVSGISLVLWGGWPYLGVAIPFGIALGLLIYLAVVSLRFSSNRVLSDGVFWRYLILACLLSGIMAHFLEINFGIAIVSTRTYFWIYLAIIFVVGHSYQQRQLLDNESAVVDDDHIREPDLKPVAQKRKKNPPLVRHGVINKFAELIPFILDGLLIAILLVTLGYCFLINPGQESSIIKILSNTLFRLPNRANVISPGIFLLVTLTVIIGSAIYFLEKDWKKIGKITTWGYASTLSISVLAAFPFWLVLAGTQAWMARIRLESINDLLVQLNRIMGLFISYGGFLLLLLMISGLLLLLQEKSVPFPRKQGVNWTYGIILPVLFIIIYQTNLRPIMADTAFKLGDSFSRNGQWEVVSKVYERALELAPDQDYYHLFSGRAYLEQAKDSPSKTDRINLLSSSQESLLRAQKLNPLNTDHTANIARLHTFWASAEESTVALQEQTRLASSYYEQAVSLSPNNPTLWGEWAFFLLQVVNEPLLAQEKMNSALLLDTNYEYTQGLAGDFYILLAEKSMNEIEKRNTYELALAYYSRAADLAKGTVVVKHLISLSNTYVDMALLTSELDRNLIMKAISVLEEALQSNPTISDIPEIEIQIARLFNEIGDQESALVHLDRASNFASESQQNEILSLKDEIQALP